MTPENGLTRCSLILGGAVIASRDYDEPPGLWQTVGLRKQLQQLHPAQEDGDA